MKLLKHSFLGTIFLLALGSASIASTSSVTNLEDEALLFTCSQTFTACDRLYPDDYNGFNQCMIRGGCAGEEITEQ